jgi:hypothetical protein
MQRDDIGHLGLELKVIGRHISLQWMGSQTMLNPYTRHHRVRSTERLTSLRLE